MWRCRLEVRHSFMAKFCLPGASAGALGFALHFVRSIVHNAEISESGRRSMKVRFAGVQRCWLLYLCGVGWLGALKISRQRKRKTW